MTDLPNGQHQNATVAEAFLLPDDPYYDARAPGLELLVRDAGANPGYHTLEEVWARVDHIEAAYSDLFRKEILGKSVEGRDIVALVTTHAPANASVVLIDGGIHANEYEGIESALFLAEFLGVNVGHTRVAALLDSYEIWIVPLVNPDGYTRWDRRNSHDVDLNRNFDLDWCAVGGTCCDLDPVPLNCAGPEPFSEPEARAIRDWVLEREDRVIAYMTGHTNAHCVGGPWVAPNPPHAMPPAHIATYEAYFALVGAHTEFGASQHFDDGRNTCGGGMKGGLSFDWVYAELDVFTVQVETGSAFFGPASRDGEWYVPAEGSCRLLGGPNRDLRGWVEVTLPVYLIVLGNLEALSEWDADLGGPLVDVGTRA